MKRFALFLALLWGSIAFGQSITITGTVLDPTGLPYQNGTGRAQLVPTNVGWTTNNGFPVNQTVWLINNMDGFGRFSIQVPSTLSYDQQASNPQYQFSFCSVSYVNVGNICFTMTPLTLTTSQDISVQIQAQSAPLPQPSTAIISVNGASIINPNFADSPCITWSVAVSKIQASFNPSCGGGGGGGGSNVKINGVGVSTPNFQNSSVFNFILSGSNVTGVPIAPGPEGSIIINHSNAFAALSGLTIDSATSPTTLNNTYILNQTGDSIFKGPNYSADIRAFGASSSVINTTGTGSGSSITVGSSGFNNTNGITIAGAGNAPVFSAPASLTATPGVAGGPTTPDAVMIAGLTGSSAYNYAAFACDVFGGCTVPVTTSISNGLAALGNTPFTVTSCSLTGNTLTIVTSVSTGLPIGTWVHVTGTSNAPICGGWYPLTGVSGSNLTVTNVPQFAATATGTTGGQLVAFAGNTLTWPAAAGGTPATLNMPWDYYICAQRPGDGSLHIIGRSLPSTFYSEASGGNFSLTYVDFGPNLSANPILPWYISNANCTAGAAQNENFTTTVSSGGGTTALGLASPMPNAVTGAAVRLDNAPALVAAANAAQASHSSLFIPSTTGITVNSFVNFPFSISIWQNGPMTINDTIMVKGSTNWWGTGSGPTPAFGFNGAAVNTCNAWPCIYVGDVPNQANGGSSFDTLSFESTQNGMNFLVDANWGMVWNKINFQSGVGNNDNAGIGLVIRPGAANYTITNSNFVGGPNQVIDQTWTPLLYADRGHSGCCSGAGNTGNIILENTQWNRRGFYYVANGGDGIHFTSMGRTYSQGAITPRFVAQNINGNVAGAVELDNVFHDTESQATYAWICNVSCSGGFGTPFHLGFVNQVSQDTGTIPGQITGGGNQGIMNVVAAYSPWGTTIPTSFGPAATGYGFLINNGRLTPTVGMQMGSVLGTFVDFNQVPTPQLTMENGAFVGNLTAPITANRTWLWPDTSGIICVSGLQGCDDFLDTGVANAYAFCPSPIPLTNYVIGQHFSVQIANGNTGASTLNACSLGAKTIKKNGGTGGSVGVDLVTGDMKSGQFEIFYYDGTNMQCPTCGVNGGGGGGTVSTTGSPNTPELTGFSGPTTITNVNLSGDVTTTNTLATTVAKIQTVPVNTASVQPGQILNVAAGPQYINQYPGVNYDPQTTTYPIACPGDRLGEVDFTGSAATVFTLPQAGSTACMGSSASFLVHNGGTANLTLQATTSTIDGIAGATGVQILVGEARYIYSDNTNFHTVKVPVSFGGINTQTASYAALPSDYNKLIVMNCTPACAVTLPATPPITGETAAATRWNIRVLSIGASLATINLNSLTFNGGASAPILNKFVIQDIETDGSNYFGSAPLVAGSGITFSPTAQGLGIVSTSSGGSVTNVATTPPITGGPITTTGTIACATCVTSAAALTNGKLVAGSGGAQGTASADLTGDVSTSGTTATTLATVNGAPGTVTPATFAVNGKGLVTSVLSIPDVTTTVGTTTINANTCTSTTTVTMTGLTSTMTFSFTPNADVSGVTGWGSTGGLIVDAWPTSNTLNYKVCNQTASNITPSGSVTFNVSAR